MVYAKYGRRFEDDRLNRYFYGSQAFTVGEWPHGFMKPNPDFELDWLKPDDHATLELIKQLPEHTLVDAAPAPALARSAAKQPEAHAPNRSP